MSKSFGSGGDAKKSFGTYQKLGDYPKDGRSATESLFVGITPSVLTHPQWTDQAIQNRTVELSKVLTKLLRRPEGGDYQPIVVVKESNANRERRKQYWKDFVSLLEKRQSPWLPVRATEYSALNIPLPAYNVSLEVKLVPGKREIVVQMVFTRDRGRRMFAALESDRLVLDQEFLDPPQWSEGKTPELRVTLPSASIRDPLDWLEQHEWIADRLSEFHRAYFERLKQLHPITKEVNPHHQLLFDFWCGFHDELRRQDCEITGVKPLPQVWNNFALGRSACELTAWCNLSEKQIAMFLILGGKYANSRFEQLFGQQAEIESEIKEPIEWQAPDELKQRRVVIRKQC